MCGANQTKILKKFIYKIVFITAIGILPSIMFLAACKTGIINHNLKDGIEFLLMGIVSIICIILHALGNHIFDKNEHNKSKQGIGLGFIIPTYITYIFILISFLAKIPHTSF